MEDPPWIEHTLATSCSTCGALAGQPCNVRRKTSTLPYHMSRQDKGINHHSKEHLRRWRELQDLL